MNLLLAMLPQTAGPGGPAAPSAGGGQMLFLALMIGVIAFMFLTSRSQRKREQRKRDAMHSGLRKNDRVLTIGGVIGTIIAVKDDEVVVKVDESTNTKMTFVKTAIQRVFGDDQDTTAKK